MWRAPARRPASHSYGSRTSISWISPASWRSRTHSRRDVDVVRVEGVVPCHTRRTVLASRHGRVGQLVADAARASRRRSSGRRSRAEVAAAVGAARRGASASPAPGTRSPARVLTDGHAALARADGPRARRRPRERARARRGRDHAARAEPRAARCTASRCRTSATSTRSRSPARSRPARTAPARGCANLSAQVEAVELVLGDGSERALDRGDGDLLRAARVGLGALGVVAAVTLRCVPAFTLRGVDAPGAARRRARRARRARATRADHFEFWTFPHSPLALTRTNTRTEADRDAPARAAARGSRTSLHGQPRVRAAQPRRRAASRARSRRSTARWRAAASQRERVDWSFRIFASPRLVRFTEMEYARPARARRRGGARCARAILERHPGRASRSRCASSRADDALLSPAHGRDTALRRRARVRGHAVGGAVPRGRGAHGRARRAPALGQVVIPDRAPSWRRATRSGTRSRPCARELDPDGRFDNDYADRVLGPVRQRNASALAAVGRHRRRRGGRPATRCSTSKRSHSSPALAWRIHTRSPIRRPAAAAAEQRGLDLAGALLAVEPQAGGQAGRGRRSRPGGAGRRVAAAERGRDAAARAAARPAARRTPPGAA